MLSNILMWALMVFGFGFVVFWHELGHFIAAKAVGIKVEQFAVGFGQALFSWRKGLGWRGGSSGKEFNSRIKEHLTARNEPVDEDGEFSGLKIKQAAEELKLGETEYRLNWIPLGGYVKMLGQDDLRPNAVADDPRAYNKKSISARMVVVSAGVIMNIILAALGFMVLFLIGFNVPPSVVGGIKPGGPAQQTVNAEGKAAPLRVGDRIVYYDDKYQHDFTKVGLNVALSHEGTATMMYVLRRENPSGPGERIWVTPRRPADEGKGFLEIGINAPMELRGLDKKDSEEIAKLQGLQPAEYLELKSGDFITHINGQPVDVKDYWKLDQALQDSNGAPVELTVKSADGKTRPATVMPHFFPPFGADELDFGGMVPRAEVAGVLSESPAAHKILPGDVILDLPDKEGGNSDPSGGQMIKLLNDAGRAGRAVTLKVLRDGKEQVLEPVVPSLNVGKDKENNTRKGLGIQLRYDDRHAVVADVQNGSAAAIAGIKPHEQILSINGKPVATWFDVRQALAACGEGKPIAITTQWEGKRNDRTMTLSAGQIQAIGNLLVTHSLALHERVEPRVTGNPLTAAAWGVTETRDFVLQFYLTLRRMTQGSVSYTNMMGPVGIVAAGGKFAVKGLDWLIWFLAMISANLAVVNFLPIPIVDGGLFTFLIIEKIQGRPLSPRTQSVAQIVGLAVILGVFLLVTYQDIARFL
ncbi:MAG TPA: site-2 protease family protein [Tepidisphaeraceae bacterium]|jgi:regulator of sigma E protease